MSGEQMIELDTVGTRRAEIAGAGLAGLATAIALANTGWIVRVHEAGPELRELGAGLYVRENGLRVLEALGVYDDIEERAHRVPAFDIVDERGRLVQRMHFSNQPGERLAIVLRADLHKALVNRARCLGVEIVTSSKVVHAGIDGVVRLADGTELQADLIVGADGLHSAVRDSLGLLKRKRYLIDGAIRLLVPRTDHERADPDFQRCTEHWKGTRRILYTPAGPDHVYLCLTARASDQAAQQVPLDTEMWKRDFPALRDAIERINDDTPARWDRFAMVKTHAWSKGRVAILGDAVHAQPPNLGQGAGLAMSMGLALATALASSDDVETGLRRWELTEREIVAHTQRWTWLWGLSAVAFPHQLQRARSRFIGWIASRPWVAKNVERTSRHVPTGTISPRLSPDVAGSSHSRETEE
jgi:2-polyprenyl-6-methoxyphenol hydroxylase-like FAD-dependent oxidoreductase